MGIFPAEIAAKTPYGPHLLTVQMASLKRIGEGFQALWRHAPSGRTLVDGASRVSLTIVPGDRGQCGMLSAAPRWCTGMKLAARTGPSMTFGSRTPDADDVRSRSRNAHLLRDLTGLYEVTGESWAAQLGGLLVGMHCRAGSRMGSGGT